MYRDLSWSIAIRLKDTEKKTLKAGDFVVLTVKADPKFPARGLGTIQNWICLQNSRDFD